MKTFSIALRNLLRNSRRSIATLLGISIGSVAILLFGGYKANINYAMQTAYVRLGGHLQIQHKDYFLYGSGNPTAYGISDYAHIIDVIRNDQILKQMVLVVTPTLQFGGIAGNYSAGVSRTVIGNGIVAADHAKLRVWNQYGLHLDTPEFLLNNSAADSAIVGISLARVLQLCDAFNITECPRTQKPLILNTKVIPADVAALSMQESMAPATENITSQGLQAARKIELLASSPRGIPNVTALNVIHAESQGFKEFDEVHVVLHLDQAQRLVYGTAIPKITSIIVLLRDTSLTRTAQARIVSQLDRWSGGQTLVVRDFGFLNPFYVQSIEMFNTIFGFMFILIGGIVMFTVSNTMNTTVVERTVEIGTLRAIGLRQAGIRRMFVTEGVVLGITGAVLGVALALVVASIVNHLDLHWLPPGSASPVPLALTVWGETGLIFGTTFGIVIMATVSAWWPARRAARLNVVDALRHV